MGLFILLGLVAYYFLSKAVVRTVEKRTGSKKAKYFAIAVFVLIPTWDIVPGWLYFQYLCEKEAGVKVFKTVEVTGDYFKPDGKPDDRKLSSRYAQPDSFDRDYSTLFHILKFETTIQDRQTNEILGRATDFTHYGGWLSAWIFDRKSYSSCPGYPEVGVHTVIWEKVIKSKGKLS